MVFGLNLNPTLFAVDTSSPQVSWTMVAMAFVGTIPTLCAVLLAWIQLRSKIIDNTTKTEDNGKAIDSAKKEVSHNNKLTIAAVSHVVSASKMIEQVASVAPEVEQLKTQLKETQDKLDTALKNDSKKDILAP